MSGGRLLLVSAGGQRVALPLAEVVEVIDPGEVQRVPARGRAFRGVIEARGRLVSLFHLGALLTGQAPPADVGDTVLLATVGGRMVGLEVDLVDAAPPGELLEGAAHPALAAWASGALRGAEGWIPVLNLGLVAERWERGEEGAA